MTGFTLPLDIKTEDLAPDFFKHRIIDANGKVLGSCDDIDMAASFAAAINLICCRAFLTGAQSTEKFRENISATQKSLDYLPSFKESFRLE